MSLGSGLAIQETHQKTHQEDLINVIESVMDENCYFLHFQNTDVSDLVHFQYYMNNPFLSLKRHALNSI